MAYHSGITWKRLENVKNISFDQTHYHIEDVKEGSKIKFLILPNASGQLHEIIMNNF